MFFWSKTIDRTQSLILSALGGARFTERIHHVHDGEEALDYLFGRAASSAGVLANPRMVMLDIKLPKVHGLDVLREIKQDARTRAIPVVLFTSSRLERDVDQAYRLGANSYVQKPVNFEQFRETVQRLGRYWLETNQPPPAGVLDPER